MTLDELHENDRNRVYMARRTAAPDTFAANECMARLADTRRCSEDRGGGTASTPCMPDGEGRAPPSLHVDPQLSCSPVTEETIAQGTVDTIGKEWDRVCVSDPKLVKIPVTEWCTAGANYDRLTAILPRTGGGYHGFSFATYMALGINPGYHKYPASPIIMQARVKREGTLKVGERAGVCSRVPCVTVQTV